MQVRCSTTFDRIQMMILARAARSIRERHEKSWLLFTLHPKVHDLSECMFVRRLQFIRSSFPQWPVACVSFVPSVVVCELSLALLFSEGVHTSSSLMNLNLIPTKHRNNVKWNASARQPVSQTSSNLLLVCMVTVTTTNNNDPNETESGRCLVGELPFLIFCILNRFEQRERLHCLYLILAIFQHFSSSPYRRSLVELLIEQLGRQ